jgi:hypothetical protein
LIILFPDEHQVVSATNIRYRQATIAPGDPVLIPEHSWERPRTNLYGSVFKSANGYEMYYQCGNALRIGYAVSTDGITWMKPMINVADFSAGAHQVVLANDEIDPSSPPELGKGHVLTNLAAGYHMPSIIHEPDSDAPYKLFAFGEEGYRILHSHNGKQFVEYADNPVIELLTYLNPHTGKTWCSDVAPCFKDRSGYTAMVKTYIIDDEQRTRRCIGRSTSMDFRHWSEVQTIWTPGASEDAIAQARGFQWADFYGLCPFPYGSGYLAFLWLFEIARELPKGTNQGKKEVFLAYSPDGLAWQRIEDTPFIPWGLNFGEEGGMVTTPGAPIFEDNEIKVYYSDSNYEHGLFEKDFTIKYAAPTWVVRCARLPKERLVGAWSPAGSLTLAPLNFDGSRLRLNLDCLQGEVRCDYLVSGEIVATELIIHREGTDIWLDPPLRGNAQLSITLNNATLYAIELV